MDSVFSKPTIKTQTGQPTLAHTPRGFRVDFSPVADATRPAQINSRGFLAGDMAMVQVGEGLQSLGGSLGKIQEEMAHAVNARMVPEAEMTMDQAKADIAAEVAQEPDPAKWGVISAKRTAEVQKMLLTKGLSPVAAREIEIRGLKWGTSVDGEMKVAAARQQFNLTGQTLAASHNLALAKGDYAGAAEAMEAAKPYLSPVAVANMEIGIIERQKADADGFISAALDRRNPEQAKAVVASAPFTPAERERRNANIDGVHAVNLEKDSLQELTLRDPAEAARQLSDPAKFSRLSPGDRQAALVNAKQTQAHMATEIFRDIKTRIDLGQLNPEASFEGPGMEQLTPLMRDVLKAANTERAKVAAMNNPAGYEMALAGISKYDPTQDASGLTRASLEAALEAKFSGPHLEQLKERLEKRGKTDGDQLDASPAISLLGSWVDEGGFGSYKVPMMQDDLPVMTEPKQIGVTATRTETLLGIDWLWPDAGGDEVKGEPKPVTLEDVVLKAKAGAKQEAVRKKLEAEVKANEGGRFKSNDDIIARMLELYQQEGGSVPDTAGAALLLPHAPKPDAAEKNAKLQKTRDILNLQSKK